MPTNIKYKVDLSPSSAHLTEAEFEKYLNAMATNGWYLMSYYPSSIAADDTSDKKDKDPNIVKKNQHPQQLFCIFTNHH